MSFLATTSDKLIFDLLFSVQNIFRGTMEPSLNILIISVIKNEVNFIKIDEGEFNKNHENVMIHGSHAMYPIKTLLIKSSGSRQVP